MTHNGSDVAAPALAIAYHSGFGHTATLAQAVAAGASEAGADVSMVAVDLLRDADWDTLDAADGIIFGSATYMGNVSAAFQSFTEKTGRRCINGTWRDKVAAGFTNSGAKSGDKLNTLVSLSVFAAQHHMHWVNLGLGPGWNSSAGSEHDLNRLGFFLGAAILGVGGDEVIHSILDIMTAKKPYTAISRTMHIHPTVSELLPTLLQQLKPFA